MRAGSSSKDMQRMQHVFVYGTLRAGESNDIASRQSVMGSPRRVLIGSGHINGRLYDFDAYPGLVLDSERRAGAWRYLSNR